MMKPVENKVFPQEDWQNILYDLDLKIMSGSLLQISNLLEHPNTTAKQLADVVLTDIMLTSRVLKIANSATHYPAKTSDEGALTQAIVRVGFNGLRAICLCVSLMDHLVKKKKNRSQLMACISRSFETAVQARNVGKIMKVNTEDVFVAGLLQNIGELSFWCSSIPDSEQYQALIDTENSSPESAFQSLSGKDFQEISKELSSRWKLSDLLEASFGSEQNPSVKAVALGQKISQAARFGWESKEVNQVLQSQLKDLGFNILGAMKFMKDGVNEALSLSAAYDLEKPKTPAPAKDTAPAQETEKKKPSNKKPDGPTSLIRP